MNRIPGAARAAGISPGVGKNQAVSGRWTTHFVISSPSDLDEELFDWIAQAYQFAQAK